MATAALALALLAGPVDVLHALPPPETIQRIADQSIRRLDLQTEPTVEQTYRLTLPPEVLWLVVAVAAGLMAYVLLRDLLPFARMASDAWQGEEAATADATAGSPAVVLQAADELAAGGKFVEAMHVLLLRALADIRHRLDEPFSDSLTSREILRSDRLREETRSPLRDVVARVELTYFGDRPAAQADYLACRASFNALTRSLEAGAAG